MNMIIRSVAAFAIIASPAAGFAQSGEGSSSEHSTTIEKPASSGGMGSGSTGSESSRRSVEGAAKTAHVTIGAEQRAAIRRAIASSGDVARVPSSSYKDVTLSIGTPAPHSVKMTRMPGEIAEIAPDYAAYGYFVTERDEIVIVDPATYEIVYVIEN